MGVRLVIHNAFSNEKDYTGTHNHDELVHRDLVDLRGLFDVRRHARRRDDVVDLPMQPRFRLADLLLRLKQSRTPGDTERLQRGADGKADRLIRARLVCDQQTRRERIESAIDAFDAGVVRFEIDCHIGFHPLTPCTLTLSFPKKNVNVSFVACLGTNA